MRHRNENNYTTYRLRRRDLLDRLIYMIFGQTRDGISRPSASGEDDNSVGNKVVLEARQLSALLTALLGEQTAILFSQPESRQT